jgi:hypothetical protein
LWLAQLVVWPTVILVAMLISGAAWSLWQRRSRKRQSGAAADSAATRQSPVPGN